MSAASQAEACATLLSPRQAQLAERCAAERLAARRRKATIYEMIPQTRNGVTWDRAEVIALAAPGCGECHGTGLRVGHWWKSAPCDCVLRAIFRACFNKYRYCSAFPIISQVSYSHVPRGAHAWGSWGRKNEEFTADFWLTARRTLDAWHWRVFELHFIEGLHWRQCLRRLRTDRGNFFHAVYRVERHLGRAFRELQPYALWPVDEYFSAHCNRRYLS